MRSTILLVILLLSVELCAQNNGGGPLSRTVYASVEPWNERVLDVIQTSQGIHAYAKRVMIGHEGNISLTFAAPVIRGVDAASFEIVDLGNTGGFPLVLNQSIRDRYITVAFKPGLLPLRGAERDDYNAEIVFKTSSAEPENDTASAELVGVAWQPHVRGTNLDFGVCSTTDANKTMRVVISNNSRNNLSNPTTGNVQGTHSVEITDIKFRGINLGMFQIQNAPTPANTLVLQPAQEVELEVRFAPSVAGTGIFEEIFDIETKSGTNGAAAYTPGYTIKARVVGEPAPQGLRMAGRNLMTPCGDTVLLRGVNKMAVWTDDLALRKQSYAEIRKSGANCVRIVWLVQPGPTEVDAGVEGLDRTIQDCIDNDMIPMVEMHDATGQWAKLQMVLDYWKRPDVVAVIKKHQKYLIVNIANECGEFEVTDDMFKSGYESALSQLRSAGIHTPLVIDAADWGKNLAQLVRVGPELMSKDPDNNLMFSVHTYWAVSEGADAAFITAQFQAAVDAGLPLIIGEFAGLFNKGEACTFEADYATMIQRAQEMGVGYLAWEWGPGNEFAHPTCTVMNMTTDSYYATLQEGWAKDVALSSAYSIKNTSKTPLFIVNAGVCMPTGVEYDAAIEPALIIAPNPFSENARVSIVTQKDGPLKVSVVNTLGEVVATLFNGYALRGRLDLTLTMPADTAFQMLYCIVESAQTRTLTPIQQFR